MLQHAGNAPNPTWQPAVSHLQNGIKPSIGVENKSAINLHSPGERLSFHIAPALEHFYQWHHITDAGRHKDCACCTRIRAERRSDPPTPGRARAASLGTRLNPVNEIVAQSRTTTKIIPCLSFGSDVRVHTTPSPRPYLAIPESARPPLKWAARQLASALPSLTARMIQGCRSSDMWGREMGVLYLLAYKETHKTLWSCTYTSEPTS